VKRVYPYGDEHHKKPKKHTQPLSCPQKSIDQDRGGYILQIKHKKEKKKMHARITHFNLSWVTGGTGSRSGLGFIKISFSPGQTTEEVT